MTSPTRNKFRTLFVLGILGVALIAIVVTGFGTNGMGGLTGGRGGGANGGTVVAEIGGEKITDVELRKQVNEIYAQYATNPNGAPDHDQWVEANFDAILDNMIDERALVAFARQQGMVVPDALVAREIVKIPGFLNPAGDYDPDLFRRVLAQQQMTETEFRTQVEQSQLLRMILLPVASNAVLPQGITNEYANLLLEKRVGWFGAVPTALLARGINPSDDDVARFYQQNVRLFQLPERRVIRYVLLGRDQLGDRVRASDAEIQAYYQQHQDQYGARETRNVQLFTSQDEAAARAFAERVSGGASFEDAARAAGFAPEDINLANQTKDQLGQRSDGNFANLVFAAPANQLVGPQRTESGFQVARVIAVNHTAGRDLASVRAEIVTAVETNKLKDQLGAATDRIQTQLDNGNSLDQIAQVEHLQVQETPPVTATGAAQNLQFPSELQPMVQEAFGMSAGEAPHFTVVEPDRSAAVVAVGRIAAPAAPPLADIKDQVRARLINQTALQRARAAADQIVAKINGGMTPVDAFRQVDASLPAPQMQELQRVQVSQAGRQVPAPFRLLFTLPERRAHALPAPSGAGWAVVYHERRTAGNARTDPAGQQILQVTQRAIRGSGEEELRVQFARSVGAAVGVTRNDEAIATVRQSLRTGR